MMDYYGDYVSELHFDDDIELDEGLEHNAKKKMKLNLLNKKAKTKFATQLESARNGSLKIRYIASYFVDTEKKVGALAKIFSMFCRKIYTEFITIANEKPQVLGHIWIGTKPNTLSLQKHALECLSEEKLVAIMSTFWRDAKINLYSLTFPATYCVHSPDVDHIDVFSNKMTPNGSIPLSEMTIGDFGSNTTTSNIIYAEHYSKAIMETQFLKEIVNINSHKLEDLTVLNYLSYCYHVRKVGIKPDNGIRDVLSVLSKESSKPNKKKRSRTTLTIGDSEGDGELESEMSLSSPDGVENEEDEGVVEYGYYYHHCYWYWY